ncbi:MAG: hypothetical protein EBU84_14695 [Actinobacteria bacterium]|nr:hypothetical protein [Actinomycetota bacterium]
MGQFSFPGEDPMKPGDLVIWNVTRGYAYFDNSLQRYGILLRELEDYENWVYADVLDEQGRRDKVMLYKEDNPV